MIFILKLISLSTLFYVTFSARYSIETPYNTVLVTIISIILLSFTFLKDIIGYLGLEGFFNAKALQIISTISTIVASSVNLLLPKLAFIEYNYLDYVPFRFGIKIHRNWTVPELQNYIDKLLIDSNLPVNAIPTEVKLSLIQKSSTVQELNTNLINILNNLIVLPLVLYLGGY